MVYSLTYRRPPHVASPTRSEHSSEESDTNESSTVRSGRGSYRGIPEPLSFDNIIKGATCPPCTTRDFLNYLLYVEHAPENLQFFLWFRDYEKRFNAAGTADMSLAPIWQQDQDRSASGLKTKSNIKATPTVPEVADILKGTCFENDSNVAKQINSPDPFTTPPSTSPTEASEMSSQRTLTEKSRRSEVSSEDGSTTMLHHKIAGDAFESIGLKQPFTVQPFRQEIDRIIATYIVDHAPRQLNLSSRERTAVLRALHYTTHPSAFAVVVQTVEHNLRLQAHPNFIRWTICNGNRPRVLFARGLGVAIIIPSFVVAIVLTISGVARGWRALAVIGWLLGFTTLICAWKGICVVLHGMHSRHVRPWELFEDGESDLENEKSSITGNSYETAPWVEKYQKRNVLRKILDRQVWIEEPALRQIQDTIFLQSLGLSLGLTAVFTAVFLAVPQ